MRKREIIALFLILFVYTNSYCQKTTVMWYDNKIEIEEVKDLNTSMQVWAINPEYTIYVDMIVFVLDSSALHNNVIYVSRDVTKRSQIELTFIGEPSTTVNFDSEFVKVTLPKEQIPEGQWPMFLPMGNGLCLTSHIVKKKI